MTLLHAAAGLAAVTAAELEFHGRRKVQLMSV